MKRYDHIQQKLKDYSVELDKDKLWANTSHAIPQKRRRRGFLLFFSGLALLVAGSLFFMLPSTNSTSMATTQESDAAQTKTPSSLAKPSVNTETNPAKSKDTYPLTIHSTVTSTSSSTQAVQQTHNTQNFSTSAADLNSNDHAATPKTKKQNQDAYGNMKKPPVIEKTKSPDAAATSAHDNHPIQPMESPGVVIVSPDESHPFSSGNIIMAERPSLWNAQPIDDLLIKSLEEIERPSGIESLSPGIEPAGNSFPIGIALIQGVGFSTLQIEPLTADVEDMASALSANTRSLEQLYTSLHAFTPINRNIQISAGLQYSRLTTELNQTTLTTEDFLTEGITAIIIGEDGQVENLYGDVNVHREVYTYATRYTDHHKLDLELMLQANLFRGSRWSSGLWIKGSYNLLYTSEGTTLNTEGQLWPYTSSENPFHLKSPLGYGAGINATYKITPSWAILGRIGYECMAYTHGLFDDQLIYKHNIFNLGLGASLSF